MDHVAGRFLTGIRLHNPAANSKPMLDIATQEAAVIGLDLELVAPKRRAKERRATLRLEISAPKGGPRSDSDRVQTLAGLRNVAATRRRVLNLETKMPAAPCGRRRHVLAPVD